MSEEKEKIDEKWQVLKQKEKPLHKVTVCFACAKTKDCKAILLCDECIKELMMATEHIFVMKRREKHE